MAEKGYSERRQDAYFRAARDILKIAGAVLDDMVNEVELTSETQHIWARTTAKFYAERARELEDMGHEVCIASTRAENELYKAHRAYEGAIDRYEARRAAAKEAASV